MPSTDTRPLLQQRQSGSETMDAAWLSFFDSFAKVRDIIYDSPLYNRNEDIRGAGNHLIHQLLYVGHSMTLQPHQHYPTSYGPLFQWPAFNTYGLPSPDNTFGLVFLDGRETYRMTGRRNTVYTLWMVVYHGFFGDENPGQMAEMQIDDFAMDADGNFEIVISADRQEGNWIEIDRESRNVPIMLRQNHLDWENEQAVEWSIERVERNGFKPAMIHDEAEIARRIIVAGRVMVHMANMSRFADRLVLANAGGKYNCFTDLSGPQISKFGTFNRAHYGNALYEIGPDEALIVTLREPDGNEYWNMQVGDIWYQTEDYVHHQTSLNQLQAERSSDGLYRIVIAHEDPGVANWLDTLGRQVGLAVWRVYGPRDAFDMPQLERVSLADLASHLPADTAPFSPEKRKDRLRRRREAARKRWGI
jgi:hypothetical protein